jgi:endonuclease YncB( thermonuclease family)
MISLGLEAKTKKIGIWSQEGYERPSAFRKRMRERGE